MLSLLDNSDFQPEDDHNHDRYCSNCIGILLVLNKVKELADTMLNTNENKEENIYNITQATSAIYNWMKQIL